MVRRVALLLCAAVLVVGAVGAQRREVSATVEIRLRQRAAETPAIGVNELGDSGGTQFSAGNLIPDAGFEPFQIRKYWRVVETGSENGYPWINVDRGGLTTWDLVTTGYLNGASYRLYRIVDAQGRPLPLSAEYLDLSRADRFIRVGEGTVPEAGARNLPHGGFVDEPGEQRIYLDGPAPRVWDYIVFDKRILEPDLAWSHPRLDETGHTDAVAESWRRGWGHEEAEIAIRRRAHVDPTPGAMRFPGDSFYEFDARVRGPVAMHGPYIFFPVNDNPESDWYSTLEPGHSYRYEAWMRGEGLGAGGEVELGFFSMYESISAEFSVTEEWALYGFEFIAPRRPTHDGWHAGPAIRFTGPGKLQLDNVRLFRIDAPEQADDLFVPSPMLLEELLATQPEGGPKGFVRDLYVMLNDASMASLLSPYPDARIVYDWYIAAQGGSMTLPGFLDYVCRTGDTQATRMKPWLNISTKASEEEWAMLIEFLAAPIDPEDPADVAAKPWAYLRYLERGVATPWTDEFDRIIIEFANETWHNGAVEEQWTGWHRDYWVHHGGYEFGLWAQFIGEYLAEHSPWFAPAREAGKIELLMGSNYGDYAEVGFPLTTHVDAVGHATYVGPRWEVEETPETSMNEQGLRATLFGYVGGLDEEIDSYRVMREELAAAGHHYELYAYEGGPSGYVLPGTADESVVEIGEQYGKSLAMAVATLDSWLGAYQAGFSLMGFHAFTQGEYWSSHTTIRNGFRRHVPWLAMTLLNRYGAGTMIEAEVAGGPTQRWRGDEEELIGAAAFRDGSKVTIFLLSRALEGETEVTLRLPAGVRGDAVRYALEGDPRATNRFGQEVSIVEESVRLRQATTVSIPASSIHVYVVNTRLRAAGEPPAAPEPPEVSAASSGGATIAWDSVPGATGYRVYRGSVPHFRVEEAEAVFESTASSFADAAARRGRAHYRVAAVNAWGEGLPSLHTVSY